MSASDGTNAMEIEARAAAWLGRRDGEGWTDTEQAELDSWLAESWANRAAFWRLDHAWNYADRLTALRPAPEKSDEPRARRLPLARIAIALTIVVSALGVAGTLYPSRSGEHTYATALGGHELVTLDDGSRVELNTDTVLRTAMRGSSKIAWLDRGEAYFQIKHDASRPFVVIAGNRRVTDLGTKFLVRRDANRLKVAVVEGRVRLDGEGQRTALLTQGDIATVAPNALSVARNSAEALGNQLGWRQGLLVFKRNSLADVAAEFNRYNRRKLIVADSAAARLTIDGTFRANNVEAFTDIAQDILGLRADRRADEIVISR